MNSFGAETMRCVRALVRRRMVKCRWAIYCKRQRAGAVKCRQLAGEAAVENRNNGR